MPVEMAGRGATVGVTRSLSDSPTSADQQVDKRQHMDKAAVRFFVCLFVFLSVAAAARVILR